MAVWYGLDCSVRISAQAVANIVRFAAFVISVLLLAWGFALHAAKELREARLTFSNGATVTVELADTIEAQRTGLMGRMQMDEGEGMLFVFPREWRMQFWMRNTYIPLSIAFFDKNKCLMSIMKMRLQSLLEKDPDLTTYQSKHPGQFALEVNQGWFERHGVEPGMTFELTE